MPGPYPSISRLEMGAEMIQFRKVVRTGNMLSACCGKPSGFYHYNEVQWREKRPGGRWGHWQKIDEAKLPTVTIKRDEPQGDRK